MSTTALEIALGAVIALLTTIAIESIRRPKLHVELISPGDMDYTATLLTRPAAYVRFLHVNLRNQQLPRILRWLSRDAAMQCQGTITFYHLDGQRIFDRLMEIRWDSTPEPERQLVRVEEQNLIVIDQSRFVKRVDIYAGNHEQFTIAARFDDEEPCYGWSNDSYLAPRTWRPEQWRLAPGRYFAKVTFTSANASAEALFRLINDVPRRDFRLEAASKDDWRKVS